MPDESEFVTKTVRIPESWMPEIENLVKAQDLTFSQWARRALRKQLRSEQADEPEAVIAQETP